MDGSHKHTSSNIHHKKNSVLNVKVFVRMYCMSIHGLRLWPNVVTNGEDKRGKLRGSTRIALQLQSGQSLTSCVRMLNYLQY
ncbi:hypothetical protein PHET_01796 [Paragonimus heterotremus]|uniref:Uncharacterized protein n=1 Tax=Paragonimus heterotremus TaxID=100268 RepID=A0A8J4WIZ4_9TREM|nr:hypothetical protein PHET_01796 [Paragonimus heterotremus]